MKRKQIVLFILSLILVLFFGYKVLPYITPGVTIINKTHDVIYINVTQYAKGVTAEELTDAELAQLKIFVPIQTQKTHYFPASFSALFDSRVVNFAPIWKIGSRADTSNSGGHAFYLDSHKGTCQVEIEIYDDSYKIIPKEMLYCYRKMLPSGGTMTIHSAEKIIFNDYSPNADKIEKQFIRLN